MPESYQVGAPPTVPSVESVPAGLRKRRRTGLIVALVLSAALGVTAVGLGVVWFLVRDTPLEAAKATCAADSPAAVIGDDGDSLTLRTKGRDSAGLGLMALDCFLTELEVTDAVKSELETTRALDGRQSADWGDFHATWTYHPKDGLQMVVTMR
jgi:hypothetical protein